LLIRLDGDRGWFFFRRSARRTDLLLEFPAPPLEVDFRLAQRVVAFVEEPRLVAHQLLAFLDLPLPLVDAVHDGPELVLAPHEIGFPFLELAERLLTRLQLVPKRGAPTSERLFRPAFRAVSLEGRCRLPTRAGPGTAPVPRLLAAELQDLSKVRLLRGFGTRRRRCLVESSLRELRVAVQALR